MIDPKIIDKLADAWVIVRSGDVSVALRSYAEVLRRLRNPEDLARRFHEAYERLAPDFGYETRTESAVPWEQVPDNNRALMTAVAEEITSYLTIGPNGSNDY